MRSLRISIEPMPVTTAFSKTHNEELCKLHTAVLLHALLSTLYDPYHYHTINTFSEIAPTRYNAIYQELIVLKCDTEK